MDNQHWTQDLVRLRACQGALDWCKGEGDYAGGPAFVSLEEAWQNCTKPDWMLWLATRVPNITHQQIVLVACVFARLSLHLIPAGENRPRICIETTEAWANGNASLQEVQQAKRDCWQCYDQYYRGAAAAGAAAAAEGAAAAAAAEAAAGLEVAAEVAVAAAAKYGSPNYYIIRDRVLSQCADLCRQMLPVPEIRKYVP
jgi:hypothetical protein